MCSGLTARRLVREAARGNCRQPRATRATRVERIGEYWRGKMTGLHKMVSKARQYEYTVLLDPDEESGGYTVTVPALPGIVTQGDTVEEALEMARDAIALYLEDLQADGEPIPTEHVPPQLVRVTVAA